MSYTKMVSDFYDVLSKEGGKVASVDALKHAEGFSSAVDGYVSKLLDPGKRTLASTTKQLMVPVLVAALAVPGTGVSSVDAAKAALQYATAVQTYALACVVSLSPVLLPLGGITVPPGNVTVGVLTTPSLLTLLQTDFTEIFTAEPPPGTSLNDLVLIKATKFADAIKKGFTSGTLVSISGVDSLVPVPVPFSISGPLGEV